MIRSLWERGGLARWLLVLVPSCLICALFGAIVGPPDEPVSVAATSTSIAVAVATEAPTPTIEQPSPTSAAAALMTAAASLPSPTLVPPTVTPSAEVVLLALVRDAASPNLRDGRWDAQRTGDEVRVTLPLNLLGSNEQIVRLNQTRMAGVVKAVFDTYADVQIVNVIGTSPIGDVETPGISVLVTREQYAAWSGRVADLPGWQVGQRFR